ncbi:hypothetical protein HZM05_002831 [Salmonella enterica]|uniref:Uncharacterized protein n=1 Tax=Salmonella enterica I TaxID=59201 RepID=A0A379Y430_SALET|nr:hypothetical protein [Salmonella enterica]SUI40280.1 Uncharacterised protein [Salmonella enterica subsp. enterica]EHS0389653.1 hypothetical protein [Salmonella enterica]EKA1638891.1 hypothetical protein [Salmonella enterica]ELS1746264.1 hypothetical protein [Salmonella enterica]
MKSSVPEYQDALNMLEILDINLDEFLFDKYLNIALDYEMENGIFCNVHRLNNSTISMYQTTVQRRAICPILAIVTFGGTPFYVLDFDGAGCPTGRSSMKPRAMV